MSEEKDSAATVEPKSITNWDEQYKKGPDAVPWDSGEPAEELAKHIKSLQVIPASALEIGCGTGTNALWMAKQGMKVIATDLSPTAIDLAKNKLESSSARNVEFKIADVIKDAPVPDSSVDFVFDRGVYHVMSPENREMFVTRVANALKDGGTWLCFAGSADESQYGKDQGPPQLKASEVVDIAEKYFEIQYLKSGSFTMPDGTSRKMWEALYRKRK